MSRILGAINEAQSQWEIKHELINTLVKAGIGETSDLWLATIGELQGMVAQAGLKVTGPVEESPIPPIAPVTTPSMQSNPSTTSTQKVNPVTPAAKVSINPQANVQPQASTIQQLSPQDMTNRLNQLSTTDKTKFAQILQQLAGIAK